MTDKKILTAGGAPPAIGPYSQAVKAGDFIFTSGQIPLDAASGEVVPGGIGEQATRAIENLKALLEGCGSDLAHVVKTTLFLRNMADFPVVNEIYGIFFPESPPARSTVEVAGLPKGALIEIEAVALSKTYV
jgi:2-iminobutanoate/2-iminopropanoate deaminase